MNLVCEKDRLIIRHFALSDARFVLQLLNDESFIRYIADKNIATITDAMNYLSNGPISSYHNHGFGLNIVILKKTREPISMCGLLKRDELDHPDLGFAFLPAFWGHAYAVEAADAVLRDALSTHTFTVILAVTLANNTGSNHLLKKLSFTLKGVIHLYGVQNNLYEYRR